MELHADCLPHHPAEFQCCVVHVGRCRELPEVMAEVLERPPCPRSECLDFLAALRSGERAAAGGLEVGVEFASSWSQPLVCPITCECLRMPARGRNCRHLRCFELEAYLERCNLERCESNAGRRCVFASS